MFGKLILKSKKPNKIFKKQKLRNEKRNWKKKTEFLKKQKQNKIFNRKLKKKKKKIESKMQLQKKMFKRQKIQKSKIKFLLTKTSKNKKGTEF